MLRDWRKKPQAGEGVYGRKKRCPTLFVVDGYRFSRNDESMSMFV